MGKEVDNSKMINTSECEDCINSVLDESNKAKIIVFCGAKEKEYIYGQCIPCEYYESKKKEE